MYGVVCMCVCDVLCVGVCYIKISPCVHACVSE